MEVKKIISLIENFAPLETQERWDNSGWQIDFKTAEVNKVLLALTVTEDVVNQAVKKGCDLIMSHHPLFFIPFQLNKNIPIYSAHTNLDKAKGGTTDTLINVLGLPNIRSIKQVGDFLRVVELEKEISLNDFINILKDKLKLETIRVVNQKGTQSLKKLAFCSGSGADFIEDAEKVNADIFITGDLKYHCSIDSGIILADAGHFESERPVLNTIKDLLKEFNLEIVIADEKSPFINY